MLTLNLGKIDRNIRPLDPSTANSLNCPTLTFPQRLKSTVLRSHRPVLPSRWATVNFSIDGIPSPFTSGQTDSVTVSFSKDELESLSWRQAARPVPLTYLVPLSKVFGSLGTVKLGFGESFPLSLEFTLNDGAEVCYSGSTWNSTTDFSTLASRCRNLAGQHTSFRFIDERFVRV